MKIANGLALDFDPGAAGGTDVFLLRDTTTGLVTKLSSIPASRVSAGANLTEVTSSVLTITGGTGAVLSGVTILVKTAATGQSGYLTSTDWNIFNNKLSTTLADGTLWIGASGTNIATARTISGDITISNTGVAAIATGVIVNADINASAAIAFSKMAALTVNLVLASNGSGVVTTVAGFTTTIAGHLTNITSDVQAQFTTTNERIVYLATNAIVKAPTASQDGYAIVWDNGALEWTLAAVGGGGGSVTSGGSSTDNAITRWNGTGGSVLQDSGVIIDDTNNITGVVTLTLGTAGLHLLDTNASHDLIVAVGTNLTADRTFTLTTGDADRVLTLSGNATLNDWFDQSVKVAGTPVFADVTVSNASGLHILDSDSSHDLILRTTSNLSADRELIFVPGDAARTLTINASGTLYVTGGTDVAVADGGTGLSAIAALSILVANSVNTYVALTPGAGNSIRMNAGGTAWEAYAPSGLSGLTATRVPFAASATTLTDDAQFTFDATNNALTVDGIRMFSFGLLNSSNIFGADAGNFTSTAIGNTGFGYQSLVAIDTGAGNLALGYLSGTGITTGSDNIMLNSAGITTGSNNLIVGPVNPASATASGQIVVMNAIYGAGHTATGSTVSSGNIGFFINTWGTSAARVISIGNGTAPSTSIADGIQLYAEDVAASSELKVRDEAGNITTLSPHNFSLIGKPSEEMAWAYYSERNGKKINVDMLAMTREVERLSGHKLVYTNGN